MGAKPGWIRWLVWLALVGHASVAFAQDAAQPTRGAAPALSPARAPDKAAATSPDAASAKRIALVIGNARYPAVPLANPTNDARLMADNLRKLGFQVDEQLDLGVRDFRRVLRDFVRKTNSENDGVAVFYYAGHGMQIDGRNYLLPVDLNLRDQEEVKDDSIDIEDIFISRLDHTGGRARVVILDACRDNPFGARTRNIRASAGLAEMAARGTLIAYASAPGAPAEDGPAGTNSLYTKHLVDEMAKPGIEIEQMFKNVRIKVLRDTNQRQTPWVNTSLTVNVSFNPGPVDPSQADPARLAQVDRLEAELEQTRRQLEAAQRAARDTPSATASSPAAAPAKAAAVVAAAPATAGRTTAPPAPPAAAQPVAAQAAPAAAARVEPAVDPSGPGIAKPYPGWNTSGELPYNRAPVYGGGGMGYGGLPRYGAAPAVVAVVPSRSAVAEQLAAANTVQVPLVMPDFSHLSAKDRERRCGRLQGRVAKAEVLSPVEVAELKGCRR